VDERRPKKESKMSELFRAATPVKAIKTAEGFIEITALAELDDIVGGLVSADEFFCQLEEELATPQR